MQGLPSYSSTTGRLCAPGEPVPRCPPRYAVCVTSGAALGGLAIARSLLPAAALQAARCPEHVRFAEVSPHSGTMHCVSPSTRRSTCRAAGHSSCRTAGPFSLSRCRWSRDRRQRRRPARGAGTPPPSRAALSLPASFTRLGRTCRAAQSYSHSASTQSGPLSISLAPGQRQA